MRQIQIEKITLNVGAGKDNAKLEKGIKLLKLITGIEPVKTVTSKRIPGWGLRPGLPIGCKITLRDEPATKVLGRLIEGKDKIIKDSQFDNHGNLSFGIHEYIDIPDVEYEPDIGIMGFEVCVTFKRAGYRVKDRKIRKNKIKSNHKITKKEVIDFMTEKFDLNIGEKE